MDIFKNWLTPQKSNEKALCTACNRVLVCGKFELIRHSQSKLHIENFNKNRNIISSVLLSKLTVEDNDHINKVKRTKIKLAAFFAEHNIAFEIASHMVPLLKDICCLRGRANNHEQPRSFANDTILTTSIEKIEKRKLRKD